MVEHGENKVQPGKPRKRRVKSEYLFPAYDYGVARRIAETIERDGAGSLTEETLAIALGASAKSSGFRLRVLAARQFGLLSKQDSTLTTTPLAKAILKPTSEVERNNAALESFLAIPLFKAVATKFKGQPLPKGEAFRNILEREFKIQSNRVTDAERVLMDSAREASLIQSSGNNLYLVVTEIAPVGQPASSTSYPPAEAGIQTGPISPPSEVPPSPGSGFLTISEQDLAEFNDGEFNEIWQALGKVVRARGKRQRSGQEQATDEEISEIE